MLFHILLLYFSFYQYFFFELFDVIDMKAVVEFIVDGVHALIDE